MMQTQQQRSVWPELVCGVLFKCRSIYLGAGATIVVVKVGSARSSFSVFMLYHSVVYAAGYM